MKLNKILNYFGIVGIALAFTGCTDDEPTYTPAPAVEIPAAYFSLENSGDIVFDETVTEYQVPVYRADDKGSVTVPLSYSVTPETDGLTVPESVSFTEGEMETTITVSVDPAKIKPNADYELSLKLADGANTPYALQTVTYPLIYETWITVTGIDKNGNEVDKAIFCDDLVASLYGLDPVDYEVTIQHHPESENIIRVVDPYGEAWPYSMYGDYDSSKHHYMYFNISDPEMVYMCDKKGLPLGYKGSDMYYYTGLTLDADGEIYLSSFFNYYLLNNNPNYVQYAGKMLQGNITFGAKEMLASFANNSSLYYANTDGLFRIIMPGAEEYVDPSTVWATIGTGQFTDGILYPLAMMEDENEELPTYSVEVRQFGGDPNMFRIMNPWKAGVCPYGVDYSGDKYIELDTTNPECVMMELQSTGLSFGSAGSLYITNFAYYLSVNDTSIEDIIKQGVNDTYKDGIIYSAPGNLLYGFVVNGQLQGLNRGDFEWQLVMPDAPVGLTAKKAPAKVFNGNGPLTLTPRAKEKARGGWAAPCNVFLSETKSL